MNRLFKSVVLMLAKYTGLFALSRQITKRGVRILCYHGIWLGERNFTDFLFMSPAKFRDRLSKLKSWGYPIISLAEAVTGLKNGTLPPGATVITIDDGWYGTYRFMLPELTSNGFPATVYVSTYYSERQFPVFDVALQFVFHQVAGGILALKSIGIESNQVFDLSDKSQKQIAEETIRNHSKTLNGEESKEFLVHISRALNVDLEVPLNDRYFHLMSPDEVRQCVDRGIDIQLHTHRHRMTLDDANDIEKELADNRKHLQPLVKGSLTHFCYPSGVWDTSVWPVLTRTGIVSATTTDAGFNYPGDPMLALKRILDGDKVDELEFEAEMSGFLEVKRRVQSFFRTTSARG